MKKQEEWKGLAYYYDQAEKKRFNRWVVYPMVIIISMNVIISILLCG